MRPGHGACSGCPQLRIDRGSLGEDFFESSLRRGRGEIARSRKQLHQLAPANGAVVRIGGGLRQHSVQAIIEPHRLQIASLQDRSMHRSRSAQS
jgi:hypothetical protein